MGNQLGAPAKNQPESVAELTSVVYKDALGGGRFFKSSVCVHDDGGLVVVKVYLKRGDSPDVRPYEERLADIRNRLLAIHYPHVWPIQKFFHSERAVYLMRQYLFANLSRRITSRPFLSLIEKKWIAHQLILALAQCHRLEVCHGDIKAENVVMTSWDWVYLVDFAPYKPVMLPADNPADFSFFFDTSGRRKCCIAPERFYDSASSAQVQNVAAAQLTPAMDIFSVGCVLAELFMDGQPLFDYSKLLAYRQGSFDPAPSLDQLEGGVRQVVLHMIQKDPAQRRTAAEYVQMLSSLVLPPEMESVVHPFFSSMLHLGSDARVALVVEEHESLLQQLTHHRHMQAARQDSGVDPGLLGGAGHTLSGQPEQNSRGQAHPQTGASSLLSRAQGVLQQLEASPAKHTSSSSLAVSGRVLPKPSAKDESPRAHARSGWVRVHDGGEACAPPSGAPALTPDCGGAGGDTDAPGTVPVLGAEDAQEDRAAPPGDAGGERGGCVALLAVLLCTLLRGARLQEHKTRVVSLLRDTAQFCDDDVRLQRVVPYLVAATSDSMAAVKCRALRALAAVLAQVWAPWHPLAPPACCPPPPLCTCCSPRSCCSAALPCMPWCAMPPGSLIHAGPALHVNPRRARCKVQVQVVPPSDYKIFTEYILPCLSLLPTEGELSVQVEYASVVAQLAATAQAFLEQQQREQLLLLQKAAEGAPYEGGGLAPLNFDDEMTHLRDAVERAVHDLLVGPHDEPKLAILPHLDRLAAFCGRRDTADLLLPPLLTFVNSPHWQVRAAFFRHLAALGGSLGAEGLVAIIHPFLDRMLTGAEDAVVAEALWFLGQACTRGLLRKRFLLQVATKVQQLQLLQSASTAIRAGAVHLLAAAAAQLTPAEVYAQLLPLVLPQLTQEPLSLQVPSHIVRALPAHRPQGYTPSTGSQEVPPPPALTTPLSSSRRAAPHGTTSAALRNSLDSAMAQLSTTAPLHTSLGSGGASHLDSPAVPGAHSMIIPVPATAASYSIALDSRFRHPGSSFLAAALEQSLEESQSHGGHLIASSRDWAGGFNRLGRGRLHYSAHMSPAERGQHLVARAKRTVTHPGAPGGVRGEGALQHQLSPGAIYGAAIYGAEEGSPGRSGASGGAGVRDAMSAALAVGLPEGSDPGAAAAAAPPWRPQGVLLAHLAEHKKAVNRLAVSDNGAFFVSASNDESIKVWDCRRLEKDVSFRSRLTYTGQGGRITAVAACHDGQSVASGSSAGSIHIWRVEYTSRVGGAPDRYTGVTHTRKVSAESGAVLDIASWSPSLLVHTSQRGGVAAWDLRMQGEAWKLPNQPSKGMLERVVVDPCSQNWLLTGSTRGELCLWDIRFRLPVHSWQHPAAAPVAALALASAPAPRLGLRPGAAAGPMVYVAAGEHEVGLWDVAEGSCLQVLRVLRPGALEASRRAVPAALGPSASTHLPFGARQLDMMGRAKQLGIGELQTPLPRKDGCRALLSTAAGPLLWAGMDRTIRCWDGVHPQESYVVCTAPPHIPQPHPAHVSAGARGGTAVSDGGGMLAKISALDVPRYQYSQRSVQGVPVLEECCTLERSSCIAGGGATPADHHPLRMGWAERALAQCHQQPILDLARVDSSPSPVLLSCSQDGVIKAWR